MLFVGDEAREDDGYAIGRGRLRGADHVSGAMVVAPQSLAGADSPDGILRDKMKQIERRTNRRRENGERVGGKGVARGRG